MHKQVSMCDPILDFLQNGFKRRRAKNGIKEGFLKKTNKYAVPCVGVGLPIKDTKRMHSDYK